MNHAPIVMVALALMACKPLPSLDYNYKRPGDTDVQTTTSTTTTTGTTTPTTTTTTTAYDCSQVPATPVSFAAMPFIPSSEDFTIDANGMMFGISLNTQGLITSDSQGNASMLVPNVSSWGRGTRFLSTGELIVAEPDAGVLIKFDPANNYAREVLMNGLNQPNGIAIGDDDMIYFTQANGKVVRLDPVTGANTLLYDTPVSTDGISFAPDYRTLYWNSESGQVIKAELDSNGAIISGPDVFANVTLGFGFDLLDGMTVDVCGNLYVVRMSGYIIRIDPQGNQTELINLSNQGFPFISAVNFGTGAGGFDKEALYVMDLNGGMFEINVGVPGKWEPHL